MSRKLKTLAININNFGNDMIKPVWPGNDASLEENENYNEQRKIWNLEENVTKRRKNAYDIAMWIIRKNLDVVLISEFDLEKYCNEMIRIADEFVDALKNNYNIIYPENFDKEKYDMNKKTGSICVMLVSKNMERFEQVSSPRMKLSGGKSGPWARWINISLSIDNEEYYILGVHVPYGVNERSNIFWKKINAFCDEKRDKCAIIIGDMNVYKLKDIAGDVQQDSKNGGMLDELWEKGYYDAYRTCHPYTKCFSHKPKDSNYPRRLDYAIVSKEINKNIIECDYIHEVNNYYDRNLGFTDHSAVVLEIQL